MKRVKNPTPLKDFKSWTRIVTFLHTANDQEYNWVENFYITTETEEEAKRLFQGYLQAYYNEVSKEVEDLRYAYDDQMILLDKPVKNQRSVYSKVIDIEEAKV